MVFRGEKNVLSLWPIVKEDTSSIPNQGPLILTPGVYLPPTFVPTKHFTALIILKAQCLPWFFFYLFGSSLSSLAVVPSSFTQDAVGLHSGLPYPLCLHVSLVFPQ